MGNRNDGSLIIVDQFGKTDDIFKIKKYFSGAGKKIYEKKFRGLFKYIKIWYSKHIENFYNAQNMD